MSQFELNKGDNFIFAMDVSASMGASDCPGGMSRIAFCKEQAKTFAREASKWDPDGIDIVTFGHKVTTYKAVTADKAESIIGGLQANEGSTDTAGAITEAYKLHVASGSEQTVLFVVTDGSPNDKDAVKNVIRKIASELKDEHAFAISFLQVGQDAGVAAFLAELDDNLGAKHDIVDCKRLEEVDFMAAFSGALHD